MATKSIYHAYFSADVFWASILTLFESSPDKSTYYNSKFEMEAFENAPIYQPTFDKPKPKQFKACNLSKVKLYQQLKDIFPNSEIIGYVPPRAASDIVTDTYIPQFTDCYLQAFHQVSDIYDAMYDFSPPSTITKNSQNTYDGSHFFPPVHDKIAEVLQGKSSNFGIRVDDYSFDEYRDLYKKEIQKFLEEEDKLNLWQG